MSSKATETIVKTEQHDWEAQEVIYYERHGECNMCGDCCSKRITLGGYDDQPNDPREGLPTITINGKWGTMFDERLFFRFTDTDKEEKCIAYIEGEGCDMHETGEKPICCQIFPQIPEDIALLPNCSYTFIEVGRRDMSKDDDYSGDPPNLK